MKEKTQAKERCCRFDKGIRDFSLNKECELVEVFRDYGRHTSFLYRCPDCGGLILYREEELEMYPDEYSYYHRYYPVDSVEEAYEFEKKYPFAELDLVRSCAQFTTYG